MARMNTPEKGPSLFRKWLIAARPWSFPASTMPVIFGASLAVVVGGARLNPPLFAAALAAMMILHGAANMLSDVFDYRRGLDTRVTPVSGAVIRGWLTDRQVFGGAIALFAAGIILGLFLAWRTNGILLIIGAAGVLIGAGYTLLKVHALGDAAVFLNFGILGGLGSWIVQTRSFSWIPVVWTVPMALLVIAILHANNWADAAADERCGVRTFAAVLGDKGSLRYYAFLLFGSQILLIVFVALPLRNFGWPGLPWPCLITLAALPEALMLWGRAKRRHHPVAPLDFAVLDGATAAYNLHFGLLEIAGLWIAYWGRIS